MGLQGYLKYLLLYVWVGFHLINPKKLNAIFFDPLAKLDHDKGPNKNNSNAVKMKMRTTKTCDELKEILK